VRGEAAVEVACSASSLMVNPQTLEPAEIVPLAAALRRVLTAG